jgi:hypothetical protein
VWYTILIKGKEKRIMNGYKINNMPNNINTNAYVVCTRVDDELWFYGAYSTYEQAEKVAEMDDDFTIIH